jgi:TonB family protein
MKFAVLFTFLFLACSLVTTQAQNQTPKTQSATDQPVQLKAIKTPVAPYPEEALKYGIEGKVTLSITVDESGKVSEAKVLSGPTELQPSALASVRMWQYEPPASASVTETVEISYSFPKECPGPVSDNGTVEGRWALLNRDGKVVAVAEDDGAPLPRYPEEQRKSGVAGKLVLSISLDSSGRINDIRAIQSLSPALDKATMDTVRMVGFRLLETDSKESLNDLRLQFTFRAMCEPRS